MTCWRVAWRFVKDCLERLPSDVLYGDVALVHMQADAAYLIALIAAIPYWRYLGLMR